MLFVLLAIIGVASVRGQCSDGNRPLIVTQNGATIQSPGYNGVDGYPVNQSCEWLIQTGGQLRGAELTFSTLLVENCPDCSCDYVKVFDGADDTAPRLLNLCGAPSMPLTVTGSGSELFVRFISDATFYDSTVGFQATVSFTNLACNGGITVTEPSGWLSSPNYPQEYPIASACTWDFLAPVGQRIQVHFVDFFLQESTCELDFFGGGEIFDFVRFSENGGTTELGRFHGFMEANNAFKYQNYDSNEARVQFISDTFDTEKGFNMTWQFVNA